jgi:galactokinase/mevalonate kinase-like predicted kinase
VFRWSRGQSIDQNLLDLQVPLFEKLMEAAGEGQNTLIASGDVLIVAPRAPQNLPQVDVLCFGIWVEPELASRHGVFFTPRKDPTQLEFMVQKPSHQTLEELGSQYLYQMDVGLWILSDRAVKVLMEKSGWTGQGFGQGVPNFYDLYSAFGPALGLHPTVADASVSALSVAVVPLEDGGFFHFGTSGELITSMGKIQDLVQDQRYLWHHRVKPHPSLFTQNTVTGVTWSERHHHIWIENSWVPATWELTDHHVVTGVPENQWSVSLPPGVCLDVVPVGEAGFCLRPYGMADAFQGDPADPATLWMGQPVASWLARRGITGRVPGLDEVHDLQKARLFPVLAASELTGEWVNWMIQGTGSGFADRWVSATRLSAEEISAQANLVRLYAQRREAQRLTLPFLAKNAERSVFYQVDLKALARTFAAEGVPLPAPLSTDAPAVTRFRDLMFRAEVKKCQGAAAPEEAQAFEALQTALIGSASLRADPRLDVASDQIVWARSPARLDLAGGWSDTPPYSIQTGGRVVNLAVTLNGQPPMQVFVRLASRPTIVLRSIDNGVSEEVSRYDQLDVLSSPGSAFSIPKAALALAGFHRRFNPGYPTLEDQLRAFGGGIEISLLAAIPQGSGLGTSSILAGTILAALSDFCRLGWTREEVCNRTLILEQLLTTGGGWQDQYGGIFPGVKLLESAPGWQERVGVRWLPDQLFVGPGCQEQWLLYYTGVTRVAKTILAEIVGGMFLNEGHRLRILDEIRDHASAAADALQKCDLAELGRVIDRSWRLNKALDAGTSSPEIEALVAKIADLSFGVKLLGAGGGGYLLICAKDRQAAQKIQQVLNAAPANPKARFVQMALSGEGLQVTRS